MAHIYILRINGGIPYTVHEAQKKPPLISNFCFLLFLCQVRLGQVKFRLARRVRAYRMGYNQKKNKKNNGGRGRGICAPRAKHGIIPSWGRARQRAETLDCVFIHMLSHSLVKMLLMLIQYVFYSIILFYKNFFESSFSLALDLNSKKKYFKVLNMLYPKKYLFLIMSYLNYCWILNVLAKCL